MEEEGRAGWSREHSAERGQSVVTPLRWQRALGVTCLPWWGGGGTLCALKTVQDVYWEQGKLLGLGGSGHRARVPRSLMSWPSGLPPCVLS